MGPPSTGGVRPAPPPEGDRTANCWRARPAGNLPSSSDVCTSETAAEDDTSGDAMENDTKHLLRPGLVVPGALAALVLVIELAKTGA